MFLEEQQIVRLKALAQIKKVSYAWEARHAIDFYLKAVWKEYGKLARQIEAEIKRTSAQSRTKKPG